MYDLHHAMPKEISMSPGSEYEVFVQQLHQALLDAEMLGNQKNISVERNKKIKDNCGITREFDIYWEYELAGITYKTVIECKDYASPVSVEKIDALIGKVRDIPDLKAIFATANGYQSGAEKKAEANRIDLLIVREQRAEDWISEDGTPYLKEIHIKMHMISPVLIKNFSPSISRKWVEEKTGINPDSLGSISGLTNEIVIDDVANKERYSLHDLQNRLSTQEQEELGEFETTKNFEDAYLVCREGRLKLESYRIIYIRRAPLTTEVVIDFSKELLGVIEYLGKGETTAVFKSKIVRNWR